jgi:catecholate siderophore receptor
VNEGVWSWNVGAVYKPLPNASIYAAYGYTETPIGNEIDSTGVEYNGLNAANAHLGPEETSGVEVGTKWELFDGRLLATAALFEAVKDNARVNTPATGGVGNEGKYRIRGVELGVAGNITDAWSVFGGVVFLDTKTLDSNDATEIGRGLANTPLTQFSLLSKYQLTKELSVGGQAIYQSEYWSGHFAKNSLGYHTTNWWRFDAFAEYEFDEHWAIELSGLNLTDELYYDSLYQAANTFATVAPGRAGYATVKWKY